MHLETIARDPQAFILKQGWAGVSVDDARGLMELRSLYEHLQARILKLIETLGELRASPDYEIYRVVEKDAEVIGRIAAAQRMEMEREMEALKAEADKQAAEARVLVGEVPFCFRIRSGTLRTRTGAGCPSHGRRGVPSGFGI